jgi:hypothetical protein
LKTVGALKSEIDQRRFDLGRKLKTSPNDFVVQQIKLYCRFGGLESKFLDEKDCPNFPSTHYIGFVAQNGKEMDEPVFTHLLISKKEANEHSLFELHEEGPITIYGILKSAHSNESCIEVYEIESRWK